MQPQALALPGRWPARPARQRQLGDVARVGLAGGPGRGVQARQHPPRQGDVDPFGAVVEQGWIDVYDGEQPALEARIGA